MALKFTRLGRNTLRQLKANEKLSEHGITFQRLSSGDGRYTVNIMVEGQRIHRVIGLESGGVTRVKAEQFIEKTRTEAREGKLNLPKGRKTVLGFKQASKDYLLKLAQEGGSDIKGKIMRLDHNLIPFFKDKSLKNISPFDIERFKKQRIDGGVKSGTVNRDLAVLSHMFNKGIEWGWFNHAPAKIKLFKESPGRIIYLAPDQIERLLEASKQDQCLHVFLFIMIGLDTSMRRMEILCVRLKNINLAQNTIYIPEAKGGSRNQPMTKKLAVFLRKYIAEHCKDNQEWLFPSSRSESGHRVAIEKPFRRVVENAGLDPTEILRHTLRHTSITHLVQSGVDLPTVKRISGHKSLEMVERYAHQNGAHLSEAMDKLEKRIHLKPKKIHSVK